MSHSTSSHLYAEQKLPRDCAPIPPTSLIEHAELALNSTEAQRLVDLACRLTDIVDPDMASALIDEEGQRITNVFLVAQAENGWGWDGPYGWSEDDWDIESVVVHQLNIRLNAMTCACARLVASRVGNGAGHSDPVALLLGHMTRRLEQACLRDQHYLR